jgi:hypothetical protein
MKEKPEPGEVKEDAPLQAVRARRTARTPRRGMSGDDVPFGHFVERTAAGREEARGGS